MTALVISHADEERIVRLAHPLRQSAPGRLDVEIGIERPDAETARDIFSKYVVGACRCALTASPSTAARP